MLIARALAASATIAGIWLVGIPILLLAVGPEPCPSHAGCVEFLGAVPLTVGVGLFGWVTWALATVGRGTALAFDSPARLVCGGPYRWMRNPMYAGDALILIGEAILLESTVILAYAVLYWLALHLMTVMYEEPRLRRRFGSAYQDYSRSVPRWIPRLVAAAKRLP